MRTNRNRAVRHRSLIVVAALMVAVTGACSSDSSVATGPEGFFDLQRLQAASSELSLATVDDWLAASDVVVAGTIVAVEDGGTETPVPDEPSFSFAYAVIEIDETAAGELQVADDGLVRVLLLVPPTSSFEEFAGTLPSGTRTIQFLRLSPELDKGVYTNPAIEGFLLEIDGIMRSVDEGSNAIISASESREMTEIIATVREAAERT